MKARLFAYLDALRAQYWFIPALMSLLAIALSFLLTTLDASLGADWIENVSWLVANKPEGARVVLSTIAGSMITVAGVVFSITIATVSYASSQYGPRLLTNFMRDRGNQFTLGTFIATFLYCLLVIRTVRSAGTAQTGAGSAAGTGDTVAEFVPNIAILAGIGLALCSIAVLIYFVHHIARSIHISHVVADIGIQLRRMIVERYPLRTESADASENAVAVVKDQVAASYESAAANMTSDDHVAIVTGKYGFVQAIDKDRLVETANENDLVAKLLRHPGDFMHTDTHWLLVWPAERVTEEIAEKLKRALICGQTRTPVQDLLFLVDELVEIAARALSPGMNDPFTAKNCLDWLGAAIGDLASRSMASPYWTDSEGRVRVILEPRSFEQFANQVFGQLRPYVADDVNVSLHMLTTIGELSLPGACESEREALKSQVLLLLDACERKLSGDELSRVKEAGAEILGQISRPGTRMMI